MRNLYLMSFTKAGEITALRIMARLSDDPDWAVRTERVLSLDDFVAPIFNRNNILVFVGAAGIAVRAVAPYLRTKTIDPPVLVIDEEGRFVIPILSGHLGGANRLARQIAERIGATSVVTAATDLRGIFAVDSFSAENGYAVLDPGLIKTVSSRLLDGEEVGLSTEMNIAGPLPKNIAIRAEGTVGIFIGTETDRKPFNKTLRLVPKCFHLGIGTRREITFDELLDFVTGRLQAEMIPPEAVASISSIDLKRNEQAIVRLAERFDVPFQTYSKNELEKFEQKFESSPFVRATTGVGNVCEISAWLSSKRGAIVLKKTIRSGMTLAVAKEERTIDFQKAVSEEGALQEVLTT